MKDKVIWCDSGEPCKYVDKSGECTCKGLCGHKYEETEKPTTKDWMSTLKVDDCVFIKNKYDFISTKIVEITSEGLIITKSGHTFYKNGLSIEKPKKANTSGQKLKLLKLSATSHPDDGYTIFKNGEILFNTMDKQELDSILNKWCIDNDLIDVNGNIINSNVFSLLEMNGDNIQKYNHAYMLEKIQKCDFSKLPYRDLYNIFEIVRYNTI